MVVTFSSEGSEGVVAAAAGPGWAGLGCGGRGDQPANWSGKLPLARPVKAALAVAAAVIAVLGIQVYQQGERIDDLQTAEQDPLVPAFRAALEDPS